MGAFICKKIPEFVNVKSCNKSILQLYIFVERNNQSMKRLLLLLISLVLVMSVSLCGCRSDTNGNSVGNDVENAADSVVDGIENGAEDVKDGVQDIIDPDGNNYADDGVIDDNGVDNGVIKDENNNNGADNGVTIKKEA